MSNYSYLPQFPIHAATIMLPVNILLHYKKHFAEVLFQLFFKKILNVCSLFVLSGNLLYKFMQFL
jgi:hypothetical protein